MLYVINVDNTILFYTILYVIYDNISLHSITQRFCFSMRHYITKLVLSFVVARIYLFDVKCISLVYLYYIVKYIVFYYLISGLPD